VFLLHSAGRKIQRIEKELTYDKTEGETYKALHEALTVHFEPKKNITFSRYQFLEFEQGPDKGIDAFVTYLRTQAGRCDFATTHLDSHIQDQIVFKCNSGKTCCKALAEDPSLENLFKSCQG
jgi:hypothetical protein